jgi:hypothetical protein
MNTKFQLENFAPGRTAGLNLLPGYTSDAFNGQCQTLPDPYAHRDQGTLRPRLQQSPNGRHRKPRP